MSTLLARLRRAPWLAGAVLLVFVAALVLPVAAWLGMRYWPFYAGAAALLLLLAGWLERALQARTVARAPARPARRSSFRVVRGGKGKGNGEARDLDPDDESDEPRWLM